MQLPQFNELDADLFSSAFRGIFLMLPYKKQIGPRFEEVLKLCIRGVVNQMFATDDSPKTGGGRKYGSRSPKTGGSHKNRSTK
jgi:hypothetical protein